MTMPGLERGLYDNIHDTTLIVESSVGFSASGDTLMYVQIICGTVPVCIPLMPKRLLTTYCTLCYTTSYSAHQL